MPPSLKQTYIAEALQPEAQLRESDSGSGHLSGFTLRQAESMQLPISRSLSKQTIANISRSPVDRGLQVFVCRGTVRHAINRHLRRSDRASELVDVLGQVDSPTKTENVVLLGFGI